jgi:predicted nucleotidyltransferase
MPSNTGATEDAARRDFAAADARRVRRSARASFPEPAASVLEELEAQVRDLLGANLRGMYVYGSLAFECYNPERSDVDVLVVTRRRMAPETRRALSSLLRRLQEVAQLEISFLSRADLEPWRYPTPFDYHFSGESEAHDRSGKYFAAEIVNARARAVVLAGPPAEEVFPDVPDEDFLDCVESDLVWALDHVRERPGYAVLNSCRVLAYRRERTIMSKADAGGWGLRFAPGEFRPLIAGALAFYGGEAVELDPRAAAAFVEWTRRA